MLVRVVATLVRVKFLKSRLDIAACTSMMFYGVLYIDIVIYKNTILFIIRLMYQKDQLYICTKMYIYTYLGVHCRGSRRAQAEPIGIIYGIADIPYII